MKPINKMNLSEATARLKGYSKEYRNCVLSPDTEPVEEIDDLADRIHELTRWIPVSERLPTENDAIDNKVYWIDKDGYIERMHYITGALYEWGAWRSDIGFCANVGIIDKPEGV